MYDATRSFICPMCGESVLLTDCPICGCPLDFIKKYQLKEVNHSANNKIPVRENNAKGQKYASNCNAIYCQEIDASISEDNASEEYWSEYFEELRRWDEEYWQYIFDLSDGSIDYSEFQFPDELLDELEGFSIFESIDQYFEYLGS